MKSPARLLSDEEFKKLSTDDKYRYINEMLRYLVESRPKPPAAETPKTPAENATAEPRRGEEGEPGK